jgi:DNA-binding HxlR family transcriptional regulator
LEARVAQGSYKQFCPVAMAAEILCSRWTIVLLREFMAGSTRFNDLRRGVPRMSPALLSQRLKDLEAAGVIRRTPSPGEPSVLEYHLTASGKELMPVVEAFGIWGQRWVETEPSLQNLDVKLLMWDMRRWLNPTPMPKRRSVIQYQYPELPTLHRHWWLVVHPDTGVELCSFDPGFDVDLFVTSDLRSMTTVWMGWETLRAAVDAGRVTLTGDRRLAADMHAWIGLSPFAKERKLVS